MDGRSSNNFTRRLLWSWVARHSQTRAGQFETLGQLAACRSNDVNEPVSTGRNWKKASNGIGSAPCRAPVANKIACNQSPLPSRLGKIVEW